MLRDVLAKSLRDLRWPTFWTGLGLAVMGFYFMWIYPTFTKTLDMQAILDKFPPAIRALVGGTLIDLSTPTGFLNMELFPLVLPLVLAGFAMGNASGATAGEEARGTLDLLLAEPVQRWRVLTEKATAIALATIAIAVLLFVGLELGAAFTGTAIETGNVVAGLVAAICLGLAFGSVTLAIAAFTGNRAAAIGVTAALLVATYFLNALAPLIDILDRLKGLSPFFYYLDGNPLRNGLMPDHVAVLAAVAVAGFAAAVVGFERRDLAA